MNNNIKPPLPPARPYYPPTIPDYSTPDIMNENFKNKPPLPPARPDYPPTSSDYPTPDIPNENFKNKPKFHSTKRKYNQNYLPHTRTTTHSLNKTYNFGNAKNANNRQHKRLKNIPVYTIGGHGEQSNDTFIVPKGCKIVTHIQYGDIAWNTEVIRQLASLSTLQDDILYTPEIHSSYIIDKIGSIAIYTEGQSCPNFVYILNACYDKSSCNSIYSGIIPIKYFNGSNVSSFKYYNQLIQNAKKVRDIIEIISDMYKYSIYPTKIEIFDLCLYIIKNTPNLHKYKKIDTNITGDESLEILTYLLDSLVSSSVYKNIPLYITQKELCHQFPGVYYNLVCRQDKNMYELTQTVTPFLQNTYNNAVYNNPNTNPNSKGLLKRALLKKIAHKKIEEAHMQRRPYIKKYFNNKGNFYNSTIKHLQNKKIFNQDARENLRRLQGLDEVLKSQETELITLQNKSTKSSNVNIKKKIGNLEEDIAQCKKVIHEIIMKYTPLNIIYSKSKGGKYRIQKTRKRKLTY